jgi:hypothetical protein
MLPRSYFVILGLFLILAGCRKTNLSNSGGGNPSDDLYLAGQADSQGIIVLKYWQLGSSFDLIRSYGTNYSISVTGIAVKGSDLYICGYAPTMQTTYVTLNSEAVYWKNGIPVYLGDTSKPSYATGITISGNDIYISGGYSTPRSPGKLVYWKNGIEVAVSDSSQGAVSSAIAVSGNDVYISGSVPIEPNGAKYAAVVWKNGNITYQGDTSLGGMASSIVVNNGDVYAGGTTGFYGNAGTNNTSNHATYWKNGVAFNLSDSGYSSIVNAVAISGNDIYAAGSHAIDPYSSQADYWKNGTRVSLGDYHFSQATCIAVNGSDVYIGGSIQTNVDEYATYWKNGKPVHLSSGGVVNAICLPSP